MEDKWKVQGCFQFGWLLVIAGLQPSTSLGTCLTSRITRACMITVIFLIIYFSSIFLLWLMTYLDIILLPTV